MSLPTSPSGPITIILPTGIVGGNLMFNPIACPHMEEGEFNAADKLPPDVTPFEPGCGPDDIPQGPFPSGPTGPVYPITVDNCPTGPTGPSGHVGLSITGPTGPTGPNGGGLVGAWHLEASLPSFVDNDSATSYFHVSYPQTVYPFTNFHFYNTNIFADIEITNIPVGAIFFVNIQQTVESSIISYILKDEEHPFDPGVITWGSDANFNDGQIMFISWGGNRFYAKKSGYGTV